MSSSRARAIGFGATILAGGGAILLAVMPNQGTDCRNKVPTDLIVLEHACERYAADHDGVSPSSLLELSREEPGRRPYVELATPLLDPWKRPYRYEPPDAEFREPRIWTYGEDGLPGGTGGDRDVGNWMFAR